MSTICQNVMPVLVGEAEGDTAATLMPNWLCLDSSVPNSITHDKGSPPVYASTPPSPSFPLRIPHTSTLHTKKRREEEMVAAGPGHFFSPDWIHLRKKARPKGGGGSCCHWATHRESSGSGSRMILFHLFPCKGSSQNKITGGLLSPIVPPPQQQPCWKRWEPSCLLSDSKKQVIVQGKWWMCTPS